MIGAPVTFDSRRHKSPYQRGYEDGADGHPLDPKQRVNHGYVSGWERGYVSSLVAEVSAYNREHGTTHAPRMPFTVS